jgi:hypothetical protein
MAEREIEVWGKKVSVSVSQKASIWIVSGSYKGRAFQIMGPKRRVGPHAVARGCPI